VLPQQQMKRSRRVKTKLKVVTRMDSSREVQHL